MIKRIRRWLLKRKVKGFYLKYQDKLDAFNCGAELAEYIDPELLDIRLRFDNLLCQLMDMD